MRDIQNGKPSLTQINQAMVQAIYRNDAMSSWLQQHNLALGGYSSSVVAFFTIEDYESLCSITTEITSKYTYEVIFDMIVECYTAYQIGLNKGKIEGRGKLRKDLTDLLGITKED